MKYVLCYSGGKDSTAMLIHLLKRGQRIDEIIYVDVGDWIWDEASTHIDNVEKTLNVDITRLPIEAELHKGFEKYGFPSFKRRWCTGIKNTAIKKYIQQNYPDTEVTQYIGYTYDEINRMNRSMNTPFFVNFPLIEHRITHEMCWDMCSEYNFDFGGVYEHRNNFNCWLCPLMKNKELEQLYYSHPQLFDKLRDMQKRTDGYYKSEKTVFDFEKEFWEDNYDFLKNKRLEARAS